MITRRSFAMGLSLMCVPGLAQAQAINRNAMKNVFNALTYAQRTRIQQVLTNAGVYSLGMDGIYGPGTEGGLLRGAKFLMRQSNGAANISLATRDGVVDYYTNILTGAYRQYY